jgi:TPR repeat protein
MNATQALQILDLSAPITRASLKTAYREALMVWHPDRFEGNKDLRAKAESKTSQINEAYAVLKAVPESDYPFQTKDRSHESRSRPPPKAAAPPPPTREPSPPPQAAAPPPPPPPPQATTPGPDTRPKVRRTPGLLMVAAWSVAAAVWVSLIAVVVKDQSPRKDVLPAAIPTANTPSTFTTAPFSELAANASIVEIRSRAEQGEKEAQFRLGVCYENGEGVLQSNAEAAKWYRKAAEQGYAASECELGACYQLGFGVPKDEVEAVKWFRKAANQGHAVAQSCLGICYERGKGVPQDDVEAVKWFRRAAEQGEADAQNRLGGCYSDGVGVSRDEVEGVKWYRKAADQGDAVAQYNLGTCYLDGKGVPQDDVEGVKWLRKAAEQGDAMAQCDLGLCYLDGKGVPQNDVEAVKWYILAAAQQNKDADQSLTGIVKEMTGEQIAEAQRRADEFMRQHVNVPKPTENPSANNSTTPSIKTEETLRHLPSDGRLESGSVLADRLQTFGGKGTLTLHNGLAEDAFVKMISNEKLVASFYVRGGEMFTFDHVPDGLYKLIYCTGFGWDANRRDFARGRHAVRYDEALNYATTRRNEGTTIITSTGVFTLTLHKVANGNTKTTGIPLAEFDKY